MENEKFAHGKLHRDESMRQHDVRIVGISGLTYDYAELIADGLARFGFKCRTCSIPFVPVEGFTPSLLKKLRAELNKPSDAAVTVYCSGSAEYFISGPHISVHFSAYRSWFQPEQMRVIAHPWTAAQPSSIKELSWTEKPRLSVGFMGTTYSGSRVGEFVSKTFAKRWVLNGHHLRIPSLVAGVNALRLPLKYALTFPRAEALSALKSYASNAALSLRITDTGGFTGSLEQVAEYERHMSDLTYVLCARGIENYSFRFYEALKFGRVPVLVDTQMVLPEEVDWDELIVRVPYEHLSQVGTLIASDYDRTTGLGFKKRQEKAFTVMEKLCAGGWVEGLASDVRRQLIAGVV